MFKLYRVVFVAAPKTIWLRVNKASGVLQKATPQMQNIGHRLDICSGMTITCVLFMSRRNLRHPWIDLLVHDGLRL